MNNTYSVFEAEKIRSQYEKKEPTALDEMKRLDSKAHRPAAVFSYIFGSVGAIVMGAGMSLVMTDIGASVGIDNAMLTGIAVGIVGMLVAAVNYPIYKFLLKKGKKKYGDDILALGEKIINEQ